MTDPKRGELWAVDFEPQTHKEEPGKRERPALVIQTDTLNNAGHPTTIVIPGTSQTGSRPPGDPTGRLVSAARAGAADRRAQT